MTSYAEHARDFTEAHYRDLLRIAREKYEFIGFTQSHDARRTVLWRHDIDISPQRALALARIEHEEQVTATYFVLLHSEFYNALEAGVVEILRRIAAFGHAVGLHFDPTFYRGVEDHEPALRAEREILERTVGATIEAFSWHNPSTGNWAEQIQAPEIAGMVNAYSADLRARFSYISDSHGVWRFRRLHDVLAAAEDERLHVLTHPEWWVPAAMAPRDRISRAIDGRATATACRYDAALEAMERPNVR